MDRQSTTKPDGRTGLTPKQEMVADLLAIGRTVTDAANEVGVSRQTVSQWLHHHHAFQAALNQRRADAWSSLLDRLAALVPKALDVLLRETEQPGPRSLEAAVHILKACGIYGMGRPIGYTEAEDFAIDDESRESGRRTRAMLANLI